MIPCPVCLVPSVPNPIPLKVAALGIMRPGRPLGHCQLYFVSYDFLKVEQSTISFVQYHHLLTIFL